MNAREDYPLLAWMEGSAPWPEGEKPTLWTNIADHATKTEALAALGIAEDRGQTHTQNKEKP